MSTNMVSALRNAAKTTTACRNTFSPITRITLSSEFPARKAITSLKRHQSTLATRQPPRSNPRLRIPLQISSRSLHTSPTSLSNPKFTYGIAASFTAKDRRYNHNRNVFQFNPYNHIRARRKDKRTRPDSGQDSFFVSRIGESNDVAFGIADGVGGWIDSGVDPADFSHGICDYMAHAAYTHKPEKCKGSLSARSLMQKGYDDICEDETVQAGGSTACVAIVRGSGQLEVANLGDSGFVQLRLNAVHSSSEPQTHAFNTPYQLSIVPKKFRDQAAAFGGTQLCDFPKDANASSHSLRHGDVLVFASDGVWDNLSRHDTLKIVSRIMVRAKAWVHTEKGISVGKTLSEIVMIGDDKKASTVTEIELPGLQSYLAVAITSEAKAASMNTKVDGPFAREVQREYPHENWRGGKVDDICVVVAVVCEDGK